MSASVFRDSSFNNCFPKQQLFMVVFHARVHFIVVFTWASRGGQALARQHEGLKDAQQSREHSNWSLCVFTAKHTDRKREKRSHNVVLLCGRFISWQNSGPMKKYPAGDIFRDINQSRRAVRHYRHTGHVRQGKWYQHRSKTPVDRFPCVLTVHSEHSQLPLSNRYGSIFILFIREHKSQRLTGWQSLAAKSSRGWIFKSKLPANSNLYRSGRHRTDCHGNRPCACALPPWKRADAALFSLFLFPSELVLRDVG